MQSDRDVLPNTPKKTVTFTDTEGVKHENYDLSAEEYVALARTQGKKQRELVEGIISSALYKTLPDKDKAAAIEYSFKYAREYAQIEVLGRDTFSSKWMAEIQGDVADAIIHRIMSK